MRTWFEPLPFIRDKSDCAVMNRAIRHMFPSNKQPMHKDLVKFAMSYQRGMSAAELIEKIEGADVA